LPIVAVDGTLNEKPALPLLETVIDRRIVEVVFDVTYQRTVTISPALNPVRLTVTRVRGFPLVGESAIRGLTVRFRVTRFWLLSPRTIALWLPPLVFGMATEKVTSPPEADFWASAVEPVVSQ